MSIIMLTGEGGGGGGCIRIFLKFDKKDSALLTSKFNMDRANIVKQDMTVSEI